jgi:RNA polymerase sigma-70 factor (ECF subfamily)
VNAVASCDAGFGHLEITLAVVDKDPSTSNHELVRLAQNGGVSAFEELYRANVRRIYALCLRMVADSRRAEELTQDVFVRAWEKLATFKGGSAFSSWLYRLAVNVVLSDQRSRRRRETRTILTDNVAWFREPSSEPRPGTGMDLEKAIAALPPKAREIFVLHDIEGYRHDEIAKLTGLAVGTSKAQLHRARRLLRKVLEP